jgi:hypothetical protein
MQQPHYACGRMATALALPRPQGIAFRRIVSFLRGSGADVSARRQLSCLGRPSGAEAISAAATQNNAEQWYALRCVPTSDVTLVLRLVLGPSVGRGFGDAVVPAATCTTVWWVVLLHLQAAIRGFLCSRARSRKIAAGRKIQATFRRFVGRRRWKDLLRIVATKV